MSEEGEIPQWIIPAIIVVIAVIGIIIIVNFLIAYPFIAGLLIGLIAGIAGTIIYYRIRKWLKTHRIVEVEPPK
jgi:hypothetical protein